jgi:hypothetical protein
MRKDAWRDVEIRILWNWYPKTRTEHVRKMLRFRRSISSIENKVKQLGIKKDEEYLRNAGGRFPPGGTPWNKGMKRVSFGGEETRFKKGHRPYTWVPVGSERVTDEGYLQRKMTDTGDTVNDWVEVHRLLWIEHRGEIPEGCVVVFKDKNRKNITIENLECISRRENMRRNSLHNYPEEIVRAIQLRGALNRQINRRENERHQ